ncbi:hypothetical protein VTK73DRAFT_5454 [Phialemonium thermophilum]|uniref:Uncharacterized protein n=1 Tax=Phialemonium thermophilum TaxID=223376 RepID=A0ABR3V1N8_9PEZI
MQAHTSEPLTWPIAGLLPSPGPVPRPDAPAAPISRLVHAIERSTGKMLHGSSRGRRMAQAYPWPLCKESHPWTGHVAGSAHPPGPKGRLWWTQRPESASYSYFCTSWPQRKVMRQNRRGQEWTWNRRLGRDNPVAGGERGRRWSWTSIRCRG